MTPSHLSVNRDADAQDDPKPETIVRTAIARAYDILCGTARTCTTIPEADALGMGDQTIEITQLLHPTRIGLPQARTESSEMHEESETCGDATSCVDKLIGRWKSWKYWERERFADGWRPDAAARVLGNAERDIYRHLMHILDSRDARHMVRELGADEAVLFLNAVQHMLDHDRLPHADDSAKARRMMRKVGIAAKKLPSGLFITGVHSCDKYPTFSGGFADVYRAWYNGEMVALKRIRTFQSRPEREHLGNVCKEALVWTSLRHPFILPLFGVDNETFRQNYHCGFDSVCLVSPWMKNGTVLAYLKTNELGEVDRLLLEIAQGLDFLHSLNIVHGDLRGTNILISDNFSACIADFGLTTIPGVETTMESDSPASIHWAAPELFDPAAFGCDRCIRAASSDVYAFACVCVELYTGYPPFWGMLEIAAMFKIMSGERPLQPEVMSDGLWNAVTVAWAQDLRTRPGMGEVIDMLRGQVPHLESGHGAGNGI